jgi:hypothetical protein
MKKIEFKIVSVTVYILYINTSYYDVSNGYNYPGQVECLSYLISQNGV